MSLTDPSNNTKKTNKPHGPITELMGYINGELNNDSLLFLNAVCSKQNNALDKLTTKFARMNIKIKAQDINLVVKGLNAQINLPDDIVSIVRSHLQDKRMNSLANVLNLFSQKLEEKLADTDILKSIIHIIQNLGIFVNLTSEEHFLRSIITMMLNFHNKEYGNETIIDSRKHASHDSAKWLKSLLSISDKSSLIKLIDFIGVRLQIAGCSSHGELRSIELTEIFFLFEEMAMRADMEIVELKNKSFVQNINAIILVTLMCKKNPAAFIDIVELQLESQNMDILNLIHRFSGQELIIEDYFRSGIFEKYYGGSGHTSTTVNKQTFLLSLSNHLHSILNRSNDLAALTEFIDNCNSYSNKMTDEEFKIWLKTIKIDPVLEKAINDHLFEALEHEGKLKNSSVSGLGFIANKLVAMGFSPRASSVASTGVFKPLITARTINTDLDNIRNLAKFFNNLQPNQKSSLILELCLALVARYRMNPCKLENQPRTIHKRQADNNYPIPTLHSIRKNKRSKTINTIRKTPSYQATFFANNNKSKSPRATPTFSDQAFVRQ